MIVDRADRYGLSQLHQLRGRIGRSDKKAYAYFVTPHDSALSDIAKKRLKALQTYTDLGSGFSLATNDLEIRGSGDILGAEQSGHIEEIGLELYMELLKDAIHELKGEKPEINNDIEILTPFEASLPKSYIHDSGSRLKFYKRLSNSRTLESIDNIMDEIGDLFGNIPAAVQNLNQILKAKVILGNLPIKSIKVGSQKVTIKFNEELLAQKEQIRDQIIQLFMSRPKVYKLSPKFSVVCSFKDNVTLDSFVEFADYIALQIDA
jgi:transcription-repair coupling factor (superfamily II helicase)